jgi:acyl-CoA thioesterase-1
MPEVQETHPRRLELVLKAQLEQGSPITIAGLGDSLTQGWMVKKGFFDRFCDRLSEKYPNAKIKRINDGIPGDTAAGGLYRLDRLISQSPDWVVVQFALNDCYSGVDVSEFEQSIESIGRKLLEKKINPILATSCPVMDSGFMEAADQFYSAIAEVGDRLKVPVARLHEYWLQNQPPRPEALYQWDGVHPTDEGHALMAEGLLKQLL